MRKAVLHSIINSMPLTLIHEDARRFIISFLLLFASYVTQNQDLVRMLEAGMEVLCTGRSAHREEALEEVR